MPPGRGISRRRSPPTPHRGAEFSTAGRASYACYHIRSIMPAHASDISELRVLTCVLRNDYGDPKRGESPEVHFFVRNLERVAGTVTSFWYDEYFSDLVDMNHRLV